MTPESSPQNVVVEPPARETRHVQRAFVAGLILAVIGIAFLAGYQKGSRGTVFMTEKPISPQEASIVNASNPDATVDFSLFWRVWNLLKEKYVDRTNLDAKALLYGAIDGMLAASGDPYTTFFDPQENKAFEEDIRGSFEGIGAEMAIRDGVLTIVSPLDDSPAERAGLLPNDRVLEINGENTVNVDIEEAVSKIRGPRGTTVTLSIFRDGDEEAREITVERDVIVVKSVKLERRDDIAVLRISRFGEDTAEDIDRAAREIVASRATGLVLDLRNNPGGYLDSAVDIAHHFVESGTVIVLEENFKGERRSLRSSGQSDLRNIPLVVLINEGSASASEILAGALREERSGVVLVGKKSFGKGSVQELVPVGQNMSVKITVARWLTPRGAQINEVGITPDVEVELTREDAEADRDPQLDRAVELLREKSE